MKRITFVFSSAVLMLFSLIPSPFAATFDHSKFDTILKEYVDNKGLVDYNSIAKDQRFSEYMESLKSANVEALSYDGQLAFWINAYNAVTIDKVIHWKPKKSVRETFVPGLWTSTKFFTTREHIVAGRRLSQDDIENEILRGHFKDPRIHFAIICASLGCPPLPRVAYTEENVQARLNEETREYMNSERGIKIDRDEDTLYLSKIFDWFKEDFIHKAGSVETFIRPYLNQDAVSFLDGNPKISYLEYNWALNAQAPLM